MKADIIVTPKKSLHLAGPLSSGRCGPPSIVFQVGVRAPPVGDVPGRTQPGNVSSAISISVAFKEG